MTDLIQRLEAATDGDVPTDIALEAVNRIKAEVPECKRICVDTMADIYGIIQEVADKHLKARQQKDKP